MRVIGHRGSGANAESDLPENTIASVLRAVAEGACMVEIDVQLSADGVVYVMHDDTVDRTTDGIGCVRRLSAAELDSLRADGEPVPTLAALLEATSMALNVELKSNEDARCPATDRVALAAAVVAVLDARELIVSSFDLELLLRVRAISGVPLAFLSSKREGFDVAIEQGFAAVHPRFDRVTAEDVERAHLAGLRVNPWTVNDVATMRRLIAMGVDGIVTDHPARLVEVLA